MNTQRPQFVLAYLLGLLGLVMGFHLVLLQTGLNECDSYETMLLERLKNLETGSPEADKLRQELFAYLDGRAGECAAAEEVYSDAADKYLAVILSLLTGAGVSAGAAMAYRHQEKSQQPQEDKEEPPG